MGSVVRFAGAVGVVAALVTCAASQGITFGRNEARREPEAAFCAAEDGGPGACLPIAGCPALRALTLQKPPNYVSKLKGAAVACGGLRQRPLLLCCASAGSTSTTGSPSTTGGTGPTGSSSSGQTNTPDASTSNRGSNIFRSPSNCGQSQFSPPRVVGGDPVPSQSVFPWMTALRYRVTPENRQAWRCGGTIINERWVLTAGHCIVPDGPIAVTVRDLILESPVDDDFSMPPEDVEVETAIRHPDYRRVRRMPLNDIALLKLRRDLTFSTILKPLCLSTSRRTTAELENIGKVFIAGWGHTSYGSSKPSLHMMWAGVNITSFDTCRQNYARTRNELDEETQLCAGGDDYDQAGCETDSSFCRGGVDSCRGDSGGPLMEYIRRGNRQLWRTIGVVSFGFGCGNPDLPGVYTRLDAFLSWIGTVVNSN